MHPNESYILSAIDLLFSEIGPLVNAMAAVIATPANTTTKSNAKVEKKSIKWSSLAVGAALNIFQVSTLGQPLENLKTYVSFAHQQRLQPCMH